MSETTTYETIIAAKLHQLPVPDMADSIWSAVERQLDAPTPAPRPQSPLSAAARLLAYAFAVLVAVVLIWWLFIHKGQVPHSPSPKQSAPNESFPPTPQTETLAPLQAAPPPAPADSPSSKDPAQNKIAPARPAAIPKDSISHQIVPTDSIRNDSATTPILHPVKPDSPALQPNKHTLPDFDPYAIPAPPPLRGKKHKGVKGITSDDYKITASKDSTKKKD